MVSKPTSKMLIEASHGDEIRMALLDGESNLTQYAVERTETKPTKGNIYLAKVARVEPSLQAAFVDYGGNRNGFLPFGEINRDYYRIPVADREDAAQHRYAIQDVIGQNKVLLIQITKDERGTKGAALTTYLSLASRYCVLLPNRTAGGGISRQVEDISERRRLRDIQSKIEVSDGMSVILRTAAAGHSKKEILEDSEKLFAMWEQVRSKALSSDAPCLVHEEVGVLRAAIRDYYSDEVTKIVVEGNEAYDAISTEIETFMPSAKKYLKLHRGAKSLFTEEKIVEQVSKLYSPEVELPSGGSLVINQSEAMITIDVNSGRATRHRDIEATAVSTNLEAATEIARQLRLRDLGGLIVIDFIDMNSRKHSSQVERVLWDALRHDRARVQSGRITRFGLLEMTRQRLGLNLQEQVMQKCPHCNGSGWITNRQTEAMEVFRALYERLTSEKATKWQLLLPDEEHVERFLTSYGDDIDRLQETHKTKLEIKASGKINGTFELSATKSAAKPAAKKPVAKKTAKPTQKKPTK